MVTLEQLVPKDHFLRLLDWHIRFDFIPKRYSTCTASTTAGHSSGGVVQDAVRLQPVRDLLRSATGEGNRAQCRLPLISRLSYDVQGAGCLDAVPEPLSALCRNRHRTADFRRHCRAGYRAQADWRSRSPCSFRATPRPQLGHEFAASASRALAWLSQASRVLSSSALSQRRGMASLP